MSTDSKLLAEAYLHLKEAELGKPLVDGQPIDMTQYKKVSEIGKENIPPRTPMLYLSSTRARFNKIVLRATQDPGPEYPENIGALIINGGKSSWFHAPIGMFWVKEDDI